MKYFFLVLGFIFISMALAEKQDQRPPPPAAAEKYQWRQWTPAGLEQVELTGSEEDQSESFDGFKLERKKIEAEELKKNKTKDLLKIVVIGDTGCRLKESTLKKSYQNCQNQKAWPFPVLAQTIAAEKADLIIHLGDYHYRESCSANTQCSFWSPAVGYGWGPWRLDFFDPAKTALAASPWLFVRGNHEDCKRAYKGYQKFLSVSAFGSECPEIEDPQFFQIGDIDIINLDSSSISDVPTSGSNELWNKKMSELETKIKTRTGKYLWVVSHKPVLGLVALGPIYAPINVNLNRYLESASWFSQVDLLMAGHIHNSQLVRKAQGPVQMVLGNSGSSLEKSKRKVSAENIKMLQLEKAQIITNDFGYAVLERKSIQDDWRLIYKSPKGRIQKSCHLRHRAQDCFKK